MCSISSFHLKDCPPQSFYGVFDGHVSVEAAEYTAIHLLPNIVRHPDFLTDPEKALKDAIELTDKRFCQIVSCCTGFPSFGASNSSPIPSLSLPPFPSFLLSIFPLLPPSHLPLLGLPNPPNIPPSFHPSLHPSTPPPLLLPSLPRRTRGLAARWWWCC